MYTMWKRSYQHPHNEAGQFQKQCGCSIHVENPEEKSKIFKTSSINPKKGYKNLVDEGLIDRRACNVCLNFMPGQSKTKEKVSDQSSKSNDSNMDIDSDITEEESINLIKKNMSKIETLRMGSNLCENQREYLSIAILLRTNY